MVLPPSSIVPNLANQKSQILSATILVFTDGRTCVVAGGRGGGLCEAASKVEIEI